MTELVAGLSCNCTAIQQIHNNPSHGPSKTDNGRKEIPVKITHRGIKFVNVHRIPNSNFKTIEPFCTFPVWSQNRAAPN
ncbi:hypothetical protein N7537_008673 [Penicillium hordei]|uniref:Uncharacterized protein n=1 Tax=Penicillium hordei TaxID=40994 RepID=A0AAD6E1F5_9EURO|nr:uncharacterized protein N7537_008673 [Penicillium hordei]KAJ5598589.1 hypothetical protein N7537_008673 [Penicillium hordei]